MTVPAPLPVDDGEGADMPVMSQDQLDAISQMNGINQMVDDLVRGGMSYDEAYARAQQEAGITPQAVIDDTAGQAPSTTQETEVRRATPVLQNEGSFFDLGYINDFRQAYQQALQQTGDPAKAVEMVKPIAQSWSPAQRHVYERTEGYAEVDPKYAAGLVQDWHAQQDRVATQEQTPQARALKTVEADKAQKTMEMSNDILSIMDRLRGFKKGEKDSEKKTPKYFGRVGPFDSGMIASVFGSGKGDRVGWYVDHDTLESTLALAEAQANRGQGNFTETERAMLRSAATGGLNYRRDDESYAQIFESMYDMFKNKAEEQKAIASPAQNAPAAAAQPATPAQPAPAAAAPGFQPGKIYRDGQGRPARFRGYDAQGKPTFDKI
jgi:hypothetical protein